ncbi:MAG: ABC transporter substrate-binding protein [Stappia sp.]|uniref:ABC transporter substrate-binding protein n=1 Tax=Stappia sp. TaxID=1870903 RepID=UPI000C4C2C1D|nr:ABC transporter substrate-binding protein [Stappia sp.]MAA99483.1 ABC transporter substrate-binding protein [Stappia sp.]MBM20991.1 ABC transporter substrate-binding protein [Stappia sp.]
MTELPRHLPRRLLGPAFAATLALASMNVHAQTAPSPSDWDGVLEAARGQTVYFHAWGGEPRINDFIAWAGEKLEQRHGVTVEQVKVDDTANVVSRIVAEKAAGKDTGGAVDLVWINGENFAALKDAGLLMSPDWATRLPNWKLVDTRNKPAVLTDFTEPTEGLESPWGMAKLVFMHDTARVAEPPRSLADLASYVSDHPGSFTYPQPPNFHGSTFLKQVLADTIDDPDKLKRPVDPATFEDDVAPLFAFLDKLHPNLWRQGRAFPQNQPAMRQLLADGEVDIAFTFNPSGASAAIAAGELPDTVRTFVFEGGTIGNAHFVAIPYNANAKAGALVLANFLISPEAQARKQDPQVWGDPTVLDVASLSEDERARFETLDLGPATLSPEDLGPVIDEPHASWMTGIERAWVARYGTR